MAKQYDVIIIGGGVVGSMTARFLSKYQLNILLIEKEADIGMGTSSANSAIVHAGYDALPGTNKAITNIVGTRTWPQVSQELGIPYSQCSDYVVAVSDEDMEVLEFLKDRGNKNGVPEMDIIHGDEMRRREPLIRPDTVGALWVPSGGICDPFAATIAATENAVINGVELKRSTGFESFIKEDGQIVGVRTNQVDFHARWVVNAAGLYADEVMHKAGVILDPITNGPFVDDQFMTNIPGIFAAGDVVQVYDLVDWVTEARYTAGKGAARYARAETTATDQFIPLNAGENIRYVVPHKINPVNLEENLVRLQMRAINPIENRVLVTVENETGEVITKKAEPYARPGEIITLAIKPDVYDTVQKAASLTAHIRPR